MRTRILQPISIGLLGVAAFCAWVAPASAGPQPGDTEVIVSGGLQHDGAQFQLLGVELIPKPGQIEGTTFIAELTLDHQITPHFGLELDGGYDPRLGEPHEAAVTTATAGLVYHVNPADKGVLYLTTGAGAAWFNAVDRGIKNNVTGTGTAAIGVKIYLNPRILLRIDFRLFYAPSPFTDQDLLQRATLGLGVRF
jgi:hypothetical protein